MYNIYTYIEMANFLWVKTTRREELLKALDDIPEIGRKSKSAILEMALEEFVLKHQKSNNPQTQMELFGSKYERAIPNVYHDDEPWQEFYDKLNNVDDFNHLAKKLDRIIKMHTRKGRELELL